MERSRAAVLGVAAGVLALGIGCARRPNAALDHARAAMQQANQTPEITTNGPVALHEAQEELARADRAYKDDKDDVVVDHHAYMTERKLDIARANAQEKTAEQELAQLNEKRSEVVINSRTGEANAAREEAAVARAELRRLQREMSALHPRQTERGVVLTLSNVLFETDRADLKPGAMNDLNNLATFLRQNPSRHVMVEGHTDNTGTSAYNQELSQARAAAVRTYLVRNGVTAEQIESQGFGESSPVATNASAEGRQQNRRVEIVIAPTGGATAGVRRERVPTGATSGAGTSGGTMRGDSGDTDVRRQPPADLPDDDYDMDEDSD